ncbi:T9SS type A sorting domain-containing protein [Algibacter sp. AS12]|uniref:T9SS type A sorting domain-containing protein n=1 Tax=Algibacter sp. AS12 TaxID=3135773 RepID=UPI00398B8288
MKQFHSKSKIVRSLNFLFLIIPLLTFSQVQIGEDILGEGFADFSGSCVSISGDGTMVAIGAPFNYGSSIYAGQVRVYENKNNEWIQVGSDIDGKDFHEHLGSYVSLSNDGSVVAISAPDSDKNGTDSGNVSIYKNINDEWTQVGNDILGKNRYELLGTSLSISNDGSIVAIGAPESHVIEHSPGLVRVYKYIGNNWIQIGSDIYGEDDNDESGLSVSLSGEGNIVAIGAPHNAEVNNASQILNIGHVRVFKNINDEWIQLGDDIDGEEYGQFGYSVSLSNDGNILAIGGIYNDGITINDGQNEGHVRVYKYFNNSWIQVGDDIDGEDAEDKSGWSVSLSNDGSIVAIGAPDNDGNGDGSGHVRVYQNLSNHWSQIGSDINGVNSNDEAGFSTSISSDGTILAVGSRFYGEGGFSQGHVRVYDLTTVLSAESFKHNFFSYYPNPVKNELNINLITGLKLKQINIYNIQSQYLYSVRTSKIDVTNLSSGMYFLEVETNQGKSAKKILIE